MLIHFWNFTFVSLASLQIIDIHICFVKNVLDIYFEIKEGEGYMGRLVFY